MLHDLNQESFMKIAVKNLSGCTASFRSCNLATHTLMTVEQLTWDAVTITTVDADSDAAQKALALNPTRLTAGIELSDDPFPLALQRLWAVKDPFGPQET